MISSHGLKIAEGENRENSQTTDLSQREHPVHNGRRRGLATGGEADRDVGDGGHCDEVEVVGVGGAVAGRAAGKMRWRGEGELSRGKVIGLGEGARVVRTEGKQGR